MWGHHIGLIQAAEALAPLLDRQAQCYGLAHRSDIFLPDQDLEALTPQDHALAEELSQHVSQAIERYREVIQHTSPALESAMTYVRDDLHLPWPWLAYELHLKLLMDTYQYILGIEAPMGYRLDPDDPPVAHFSWTFETRPGETRSAVQRRFTEEANAAFAQLQALPDDGSQVPVGRIRRDLKDTVRRNTRWFYQYRISKVPQRQLAITYHAERAVDPDHDRLFPLCSCLTNVRGGIREAERVLGLTPFHF